jgi:peptide/nickel transport system substrate-binding protein
MEDVTSGKADSAFDVPPDAFRRLESGAGAGRGGLEVNAWAQIDMLTLNTHRPLFADVRIRRAANYAIDRTALAALGDPYSQIPGRPTDQYLEPPMPGFRDVDIYPFRPDVARARKLAGGRTGTAVLYTCDQPPCDRMAAIIKTDLAAIGITVEVKTFGVGELPVRATRPGEPYDILWGGWVADYLDPDDTLDNLMRSGPVARFDDPVWTKRLEHAASLSGPQRYLAYGRLDAELARDAAPWIAYANRPNVAYLSARMGCRVFQPVYLTDFAALCIRRQS